MSPATPSDRLRPYLVILATAGMIVFNWMAAAGYVNGVTPEEISNKYPTIVTPAGYAFSIWSLIYVGLIAFSIYQVLPSTITRFRSMRSLYILSCVLNCAWIYSWHHDHPILCLVIIVMLWLTLLFAYRLLDPGNSVTDSWFVKAPFGLYLGWVTAATLVNLAVVIQASEFDLSTVAMVVVGVVLILLAALIGVSARVTLSNFFFPLAIAWALTAIAVKQSGNTAIVVACAVGVVACLVATLSFVVNLKGTLDE